MSLIECPECQSRVSDKAMACINCGCPSSEFIKPVEDQILASEPVKESLKCFECKAAMSETDTYCPTCNALNSRKISYSDMEKRRAANKEQFVKETEAQRETRELKQRLHEASQTKQPMSGGQMFLCIVGALLFFFIGIPLILAILSILGTLSLAL